MTTLSRQRAELARDEATEFSNAYEVDPNHHRDEELRLDFQYSLERRFRRAVTDTHMEYRERALELAREGE